MPPLLGAGAFLMLVRFSDDKGNLLPLREEVSGKTDNLNDRGISNVKACRTPLHRL